MNLHAALHRLGTLGILRLRAALRGLNQLEYAARAGKGVLQLRHHAGNLVKGLGVLVGVVQEAGEIAHGNAAANGDKRTCQAHTRIDYGVDKPGAGIDQRGEENGFQRRLLQPSVDLVELLHGSVLMAEGTNHLDIADGFIDEARLLATGDGLQPEHGIGSGGDEVRNQQRQGRDAHHHQRNAPMDTQHEE